MIDLRVADAFAAQVARHRARAAVDRHLERAEPVALSVVVRTTGDRILSSLREEPLKQAAK